MRPSLVSREPVKSVMERTARPAPSSSRDVPPVETISTPSSSSPRAKSTIPVLSETDSSARRIRTSPGWVTRGNLSVDEDPPRVRGVPSDTPRGQHPDRLRQQRVLHRLQRATDLRRVRRVRQVDGALEDDRPGVHALVDEVDGDPEHL